jgi:hypothetical protein
MSRRVAFCSRLFPGISGHSLNLSAIPRDTPATQKRQSLSTPRSSNNSIIMDNVRFSLAALARDTMSSAQHATTMFLPHRRDGRWSARTAWAFAACRSFYAPIDSRGSTIS